MQGSSGTKLPSFSDIVSPRSEPSIRDLANIAYTYNKLSTNVPTVSMSAPKKHDDPVYVSNSVTHHNTLSSFEGTNVSLHTTSHAVSEVAHSMLNPVERGVRNDSSGEMNNRQDPEGGSDSELQKKLGESSNADDLQKISALTSQTKTHMFAVKYNLSCSSCERRFSLKEELIKHVCQQKQEANVLYECQECKSLFPSLNNLAVHMKIHEQHVVVTGPESSPQLTRIGYSCNFCDKVLSSKGSLAKHHELHKGLKPYECSFCGKTFSLKGNRDKHQLIHSGNRPFQCILCSKTFTLKGNLQQHELTHSDMKMFKCTICEREFTLKGNLDKHIKRHLVGMVKPRSSVNTRDRKRKRSAQSDVRVEIDESVGNTLATRINDSNEVMDNSELGSTHGTKRQMLTVVKHCDVAEYSAASDSKTSAIRDQVDNL